jgi:hypothetical protein
MPPKFDLFPYLAISHPYQRDLSERLTFSLTSLHSLQAKMSVDWERVVAAIIASSPDLKVRMGHCAVSSCLGKSCLLSLSANTGLSGYRQWFQGAVMPFEPQDIEKTFALPTPR